MKSPVAAFFWLMVSLAAVAGYYGGRHQAGGAARAVQRQKDSAAGGTGRAADSLPGKGGTAVQPSGTVSRWADRLRHCRAEELPGLYAEIQALAPAAGENPPNDGETRLREEWGVAMRLLCCRWAELDASGGLAFLTGILDKAKTADSGQARVWILAEWALRDPAAAHGAVMALPDDKRPADLLESVGLEVMGAGAEPFWAWFKTVRAPMPREGETNAVWRRLAATHFEELSAMAASGPQGLDAGGRSWNPAGLYQVLATAMAGRDAEGALKWAESQPAKVRNAALTGALETLTAVDPGKAVAYLMAIKDGENPLAGSGAYWMAQKALRAMSMRDPLGTVDWFQANGGRLDGGDSYGGEALASGLSAAMKDGRITPEQAFAKVSAAHSENSHVHLIVLHDMWLGLPADQLAKAAEWLRTVDSEGARDSATRGLFSAWAAQDRAAAMRFTAETGDLWMVSVMFEGLTASASGGWSDSAGDRVAAVLKEVPLEHRAQAVSQYMRSQQHIGHTGNRLPFFDGAVMAQTLEGLAPAESTGQAAALIAERWAATDPASAIDWAWDWQDASLREKATGAAVKSWAREDAWGASHWIETQPAGEQRDRAAHHLARFLCTDDPESAWTWAGSIEDPAIRQEARAAVLRMWRYSAAAAAQAAVDSLPSAALSPADRQKLTDTLLSAGSGKQ